MGGQCHRKNKKYFKVIQRTQKQTFKLQTSGKKIAINILVRDFCNKNIIIIFLSKSIRSNSKESTCKAGDRDLISGSERSPGEGNGNLIQYSCLENSMDRGTWGTTVHEVAKSQTPVSD